MTNETTSTLLPVNRTYKSTVFTMLFEDKDNLLELYNAMSGKHYTDPGLLEINTGEQPGAQGSVPGIERLCGVY